MGHTPTPPTVSFKERLATDPEFRRQIEDGRRRSEAKKSLKDLKEALRLSQGKSRKKLF